MFGYKTHVSIDRKYGFVRCFTVTSATAHDGAQLANVLDPANTASDVWADTAYRSKINEAHLAKHGRRSKIHFRRQPGHDLTPAQRKATVPAPRSAPEWRRCSRPRSIASACSCAPSAWPGPGPRSASPTSPTTSSASSGSKPSRLPPESGAGRASEARSQ